MSLKKNYLLLMNIFLFNNKKLKFISEKIKNTFFLQNFICFDSTHYLIIAREKKKKKKDM